MLYPKTRIVIWTENGVVLGSLLLMELEGPQVPEPVQALVSQPGQTEMPVETCRCCLCQLVHLWKGELQGNRGIPSAPKGVWGAGGAGGSQAAAQSSGSSSGVPGAGMGLEAGFLQGLISAKALIYSAALIYGLAGGPHVIYINILVYLTFPPVLWSFSVQTCYSPCCSFI